MNTTTGSAKKARQWYGALYVIILIVLATVVGYNSITGLSLQSKNQTLENEIQALQSQEAQVSSQSEALSNRLAALNNSISAQDASLRATLAADNAEIAKLEADIAQLQLELNQATSLLTSRRASSASISFSPSWVPPGGTTALTVTVSDTSPGQKTVPTGSVMVGASVPGGTFSWPSCTLVAINSTASACSLSYTVPTAIIPVTISALYSGDSTFSSSNGTSPVTISLASPVTGQGAHGGTMDDLKHKVFYADGLYWAFYQQNSLGFGWRTSSNGIAWSNFTVLAKGTTARGVPSGSDAIYDPARNRVWVVWDDVYADKNISYRYGTPNPNGTITWLDQPQVEQTGFFNPLPMAALDSNGVMWNTAVATWCYASCPLLIYKGGVRVTSINYTASNAPIGILVPGTSGKMFVVIGISDGLMSNLSIYYTTDGGLTWQGPVQTSYSYLIGGTSAVSIGDTLYIAGASLSGPRLVIYHMGDSAVSNESAIDVTGSSAPPLMTSSDYSVADCVLATDGSQTLFAMYTNGTSVFTRTSLDGGSSWGPRQAIQAGPLLQAISFSISPSIVGGRAAVEWETADDYVWFFAPAV